MNPPVNHAVIGYFDQENQQKPAHDPGTNAPCVICQKPVNTEPMVTISLCHQLLELRDYSFFFRAHKACWEGLDEHEQGLIESSIIDATATRGPGRPKKDPTLKAKTVSFQLYPWEIEQMHRLRGKQSTGRFFADLMTEAQRKMDVNG